MSWAYVQRYFLELCPEINDLNNLGWYPENYFLEYMSYGYDLRVMSWELFPLDMSRELGPGLSPQSCPVEIS